MILIMPGSVGKIQAPQRRYGVIREMAAGATDREIADRHDVTTKCAWNFRKRHFDAIRDMRGKLDDEFAHLWIAKKGARLAEYQADLEDINDYLMRFMETMREAIEDGDLETLSKEMDAALLRQKAAILRSVAEEVGDLKQTVDLTAKLTYEVVGVATDDLE